MGEDEEGMVDRAGASGVAEMDIVAVFEQERLFQCDVARRRSKSR